MMTWRTLVNGICIAYDDFVHHRRYVLADTEWEARVKGLLKAELKRKGVSYGELVDKLAEIGVVDSEPNIRNKLSRGKFTAVFMLQCLEAVGVKELRLS